MAKTGKSIQRGVRRGTTLGLTGSTKTLKNMRRQVESSDAVSAAWQATGREIQRSMKAQYRTLSR